MATINDYFSKASNGTEPLPTTLFAQKSLGASSLTLALATGWDTTTPVNFVLYKVDASNKLVPGTVSVWKGLLSGTTVSSLTLKAGNDDVYPAGSVAQLQFTSSMADDLAAGLLAQHNPDGTHGPITSTNATLVTPTVTSPTTKGTVDGWVGANESWMYLSATTMTVPTDATTRYDVGDKIKLTQSSTVKYFVVMSLTSTVLTVQGLNGQTVANSAISANAYSKEANPHGFQGVAVTSFSNGGSAGGTFYYVNENGVKKLWGITGSISVTTSNNSKDVTLPSGFFSSIQAPTSTVVSVSGTALIYSNVQSYSTSTVTVGASATVGSGSCTVSVTVTGT